jgi:hypothetical protein
MMMIPEDIPENEEVHESLPDNHSFPDDDDDDGQGQGQEASLPQPSQSIASASVVPPKTQSQSNSPKPLLKNGAFVFVKPHVACNEAVKELLRTKLKEANIKVRHEIDISGPQMDHCGIIDRHYFATSQKAVTLSPKLLKLHAPNTKQFCNKYHETWASAVQQKRLLNAKEASDKFNVNGEELSQMWNQAQEAGNVIKLGTGFYVGKMVDYPGSNGNGNNEPGNNTNTNKPYYVVNGFYLRLKEQFTAPEAMVYGLDVEWHSTEMSWKEFRTNVIGCAGGDASKAKPGSLRRELFDHSKHYFGLPETLPSNNDNDSITMMLDDSTYDAGACAFVHESASPLEALSEKYNWLGGAAAAGNHGPQSQSDNNTHNNNTQTQWSILKDPLGRALVAQGLTEHLLVNEYFQDPVVTLPGGTQQMSLFDCVEDMNAPACYDKLIAIYDMQLDQAKKEGRQSAITKCGSGGGCVLL